MNREGDTYSQAVKNAIDTGHKIEAIKIYREENGVGLKEAKDAIDHLFDERRATMIGNEDMREPGSTGASLIKLVVLIVVFAVIYRYFSS